MKFHGNLKIIITMKKKSFLITSALIVFVFAGLAGIAIAQNSDQDFNNALNRLRESRQEFKDARAEKRVESRERMEDNRKQTLLRLIDIQIKHWEKVQARVARMPNITDDLKAQLAAEINSAISGLNSMKAEVEAAEGREAIMELAKEIRELFKSKRDTVKNIVEAIHASRLTIAASKAEDRAAAIKAKVLELKANGKDTADIEGDLEGAEEDIDNAQEATGRAAFKEANEDLKGAYQKFRNIAEKAKGL